MNPKQKNPMVHTKHTVIKMPKVKERILKAAQQEHLRFCSPAYVISLTQINLQKFEKIKKLNKEALLRQLAMYNGFPHMIIS